MQAFRDAVPEQAAVAGGQVVAAWVDNARVRTLAVVAAALHLVYAAGWAAVWALWTALGADGWVFLLAAFGFGIAITLCVAVVKQHPHRVSGAVAVSILTAATLMWLLIDDDSRGDYTSEILEFGFPAIALPTVAWIATHLDVYGYFWRRWL